MTTPAIEISGLSKSFRGGFRRPPVEAVKDLNLKVEPGSVTAFVGPNGAGKTTTIYILLGLLNPDSGAVRLWGNDPADPATRRDVGYQSEVFFTYPFLTAEQTLLHYGRLSGMDYMEINRSSVRQLERLGLGDARHRPVGTFSKGMTQRLGLAQALLHGPRLLILDEPTTGLDPEGRKLVADLIEEEKSRGVTVFLSSHILSDVERSCDRVVMIRGGESVLDEDIAGLSRHSDEWEIEIVGLTAEQRDLLSGAGCQIAAVSGPVTAVECAGADKESILRRILAWPVQIGAVRPKGAGLEDLYLKRVGKEP